MYIFYNPTLTLTLTLTLSLTLPDHTPTKPFSAPFKQAAKCATRDGWEMDRAHNTREEGKKGDSPARALLVRGRHRPVDVGYHAIPFQSCLPSSNPPKITRVTSLLYSAPESPVERVSLPPSAHQPNRQCFGCIAPNGGRAYDKT